MHILIKTDYYSSQNRLSNKPNEDYVLVDQQNSIFIVCDGITRTHYQGENYPDPSPAAMVARLAANSLHEKLLKSLITENLDIKLTIKQAFEYANRKVAEFNAQSFQTFDFKENDRAGTCVLLGLVIKNELFIASIGDCQALLVEDEQVTRLNRIQTDMVTAAYAGQDLVNAIERARTHRNKINDKLGYGALTGEASALDFLEVNTYPVKHGNILFLYSDGLEPYFERFTSNQKNLNLEEIEQINQEFVVQRGLRSDDRTLVRVMF